MKKIFFSLFCLFGAVSITSAQDDVTVETTTTSTITTQPLTTCEHIEVSHFSMSLKTGANYFTMAPTEYTRYDKLNLMVGGTMDYTINPLFGIGLEYNYNDYTRPYRVDYNHFGSLKGGTHDAVLYGSINLSNAISPFRSKFWKNLNVYGDAGAGLSSYYFDLNGGSYTSNSITAPPTWLGKLGLNAEFTLNKSINLAFEGQYRVYDSKIMGGWISSSKCDAFVATIGLRYKFAGGDKKHARNISLCEYSPKPVPVIIKKVIQGDTDATLNRLKTVEQENAALKQKMQDDAKNAAIQKTLELQNAALKQDLQKKDVETKNANIQETLLTENSTLQQKLDKMEQDIKDLATKKEGVVSASFETIEFKSGSSILTPNSTELLDQISGILINNTYWSGLKVYGHTDNIGSSVYNQRLSESRALSVKTYLLAKGVPTSNVIAIGMGENKPTETNDSPDGRQKNRRVEFEITK